LEGGFQEKTKKVRKSVFSGKNGDKEESNTMTRNEKKKGIRGEEVQSGIFVRKNWVGGGKMNSDEKDKASAFTGGYYTVCGKDFFGANLGFRSGR